MTDNLPPPPASRRARKDDEAERTSAPTRAQTEQRARRRRGSLDATSDFRLGVRFKLDPNYEYRWINEGIDGQRLFDKTKQDDWDMVSHNDEPTDAPGSALRRAVGQTVSGPVYAYFCRKPKEWHDADRDELQKRNQKMMDNIRQGVPPKEAERGLTPKDNVYVPDEGIHLAEPPKTAS